MSLSFLKKKEGKSHFIYFSCLIRSHFMDFLAVLSGFKNKKTLKIENSSSRDNRCSKKKINRRSAPTLKLQIFLSWWGGAVFNDKYSRCQNLTKSKWYLWYLYRKFSKPKNKRKPSENKKNIFFWIGAAVPRGGELIFNEYSSSHRKHSSKGLVLIGYMKL